MIGDVTVLVFTSIPANQQGWLVHAAVIGIFC
jgi:hypothetical protein